MSNLTADREQFIRDNAVQIVEEQAALITRLRREIKKLHSSRRSLRKRLDDLRHHIDESRLEPD